LSTYPPDIAAGALAATGQPGADLYHSRAMQSFVIEGGRALSGTVRAAGNKNAALPVLAASILASEEVRLSNVPRIRDVETMVQLLSDLGADADWTGPNEVRIDGRGVEKTQLDRDLAREIRASFLLAGPLLTRFGHVTVPPPGGDVIGRRRLDTHVHAFTALGAVFELNGAYELSADRLRGTRMYLDEASVMGTENAIMAAVLAEGETILGNAACEPHIQDLCRFLGSLGARIEGIGSNVLRIKGVTELAGGEHRISPDHIEVASFVGLGAATGGDVVVEDVEPDDLISIVPAFRKLGIELEITDSSVRVPPGQDLSIEDDLGGQIPKIESGIWPAFPTDLTSIAITVATQAQGTILVFEKMFEDRLFFVSKLVSMGARVILCDPHRVVVTGPSKLYGQRLESPDIRAGMAMVIAALCAEGTSTIGNIGQIDRGYERIDERLRELGAQVERADL
jgi:UDP-N-acetylglucosamine 1-carboxyvinyltransferase